MGFFDRLFGSSEKEEVIDVRIIRRPLTQKEEYESEKWGREFEAENDAIDDPRRIEKSIERHRKKSQGQRN